MAISRNNAQALEQAAQAFQQAQAQPQATKEPETEVLSQGNRTFLFSEQDSIFGNNIDVINDSLMNLEKSLHDVIESRISNTKMDISLIPLDHHNHRDLVVDVMLVATRRKDTDITTCYAIGLANSDDILGTVTSDLDSRRFNIDLYPTMIFNEEGLDKFFEEKVLEKHRDAKNVSYAGGSILYVDRIDFTDRDSVLEVLLNAISADLTESFVVQSKIQNHLIDLNIGKHDRSEDWFVNVDTSGVARDVNDRPIRSDFEFVINANAVNQKSNRFGGKTTVKEINSVTGYVDVLMVSPQQSATDSPWGGASPWVSTGNGPNQNRQMYATNIVFTSINPAKNQTLGNMLWGLVCGVEASWNNYWWVRQGLNPNNQPAATNLHSVAGLGYEISLAQRLPEFQPLPVTDPSFTDQTWEDMIKEYFTNKFTFSLEVAEGAASTWRYNPFVQAGYEAEEKVGKKGSWNNEILAAANLLTNGRFQEIYTKTGGSGRVAHALKGRLVLMGSYHNATTNTVRSIQDFDRRYLLNLVNGKPEQMEVVRDWTYAQVDESLTTEQRIGIQTEIIRQIAPHAKITGYGVRIDFADDFIYSLHQAIAEAGMTLVNNNVVTPVGQFHYANYINGTMLDNLGRSIMTQGTARTNNYSGLFNVGQRGRY